VPGCLGPGIPAQSYCYDPFDDPLAIGLNGTDLLGFNENLKCNEKSPCEKCQGECNDDDGCGEDLFCYRRIGFESVPGCAGQVGRVYFDNHVLSLFLCFEEVICIWLTTSRCHTQGSYGSGYCFDPAVLEGS
jgi:hypothetical protein